ncbi:unnamed protein product [Adineta steineri]|uniref:F-box domain-containing protein n=3 Tax=Adineta steineri TaxID=433720 RepID=A0A813Q6Y6_9BILA|nr:unnamed protein product [Adineta steineri]
MYKPTFENLPDEIILEICQYLHCSHVLYSFFNLNSRINQTITFYRQHVYFRRASYKILLYIYEYILPQIGSSILSLTIHPLHQASFPSSIDQYISTIFSNLKILTLTSWKSEKLVSFLDILQDMKYLHKLIIQELSCSILIDDRNLIEKVFNNKNSFLTNVIFDYDCDSMNLSNYSLNNIILHNINSLTIQLNTLTDFSRLIHFIPNIQQLDVSLKNSSLKTVPFDIKLLNLKIFSLWNINYYSNFDDVISLLTIVPVIEQFSLTISTRDSNLINGEKLFSIFPIRLKKFNYTVCYYLKQDHYPLDINNIINSWQSIPIVYSFSEIDERIFLHTLPYSSSRFIIRSSLAKNFPIKHMYQMYSKASQLHVYTMTNLLDMFPIIGQCRQIRELTLLATNNQSNILDSQCKSTSKLRIYFSIRSRIEIDTIDEFFFRNI